MEEFYQLSPQVALKKMGVKPTGLPLGQTVVRLRKYGPNRLPKAKASPAWKIFLAQFQNVLVYILLIASVVSVALHEITDAIVIMIAVVINVVVGFMQENKAQKSLESLRQVLSLEATVIRDGNVQTIDAEQVVPGDIIRLAAGEKVPADARLLEAEELRATEASLTGESEPVHKNTKPISGEKSVGDRRNMMFSGTVVSSGAGLAVVTATGLETEIGKIAALIKDTESEKTPLQQRLSTLARTIGAIVLAISLLIVLIGLFSGVSFVEIFTTAVAIAVSAIPEGLVISVTVVLAIGMQRILKRKGLVRELLAAETLGSTNVICTDKTGTLTEGDMRVVSLHAIDKSWDLNEAKKTKDAAAQHMLEIGVLCNDAIITNPHEPRNNWVISGNLTDRALMLAGLDLGLNTSELKKHSPQAAHVPFNSTRKLMATLNATDSNARILAKGAPEVMLERSSHVQAGGRKVALTDARKQQVLDLLKDLNSKGLRTLALAYKPTTATTLKENDVSELTFVGIVGIQDPLRSSTRTTVQTAHKAGIRVVMVTGDHRLTAQRIAKDLRLGAKRENMIEGEELQQLNDAELKQRINHVNVFSRVSPEHKIRIVNALQEKGHVVAMTGDGVNDAPALKKADVGVALGSGTQVAKDASDLVLLNNDFSTIVAAIREGRLIFNNIKKVVLYLLSDSLSSVILIVTSLLFGVPLPVTATQILWINLTTDVFPALGLTTEPAEPGIMNEPPREKTASVIDGRVKFFIASVSVLIGFGALFAFLYTQATSGNYDLARTVAFMTLGVSTILYAFSVRSLKTSILQTPLLNNPKILVAIGVSFVLQVASAYVLPLQVLLSTVPLGLADWTLVLAVSVIVIVFIEIAKWVFRAVEQRKALEAGSPA